LCMDQNSPFFVEYKHARASHVVSFECVSACGYCNIELAFLVDSTTKRDARAWGQMLSFVSAVVSQYTINPNCVRAAVIRYTSATEVVIHLSSYSDESRLVLAIGQIPSRSGISNLAVALDLLRTQVFASNAVRSNTARIAIIVTDNLQPTSQITQAANNVRSQGITLVGVGITSPGPMDFNTLRSLTSNSWAIQVNSYGELISGARNTIVQQYGCFPYTAALTTTTSAPRTGTCCFCVCVFQYS